MDPLVFLDNTKKEGFCNDHRQRYTLVPVPNEGGNLDYGVIAPEIARDAGIPALPIRLANGEHRWPKSGFGICHILAQHGNDLADADYVSVQDFVAHTAREFNAIHHRVEHRREAGVNAPSKEINRWILTIRPDSDLPDYRMLVVEVHRSGEYLAVVAGYLREAGRPINDKLVWERREHSTESG